MSAERCPRCDRLECSASRIATINKVASSGDRATVWAIEFKFSATESQRAECAAHCVDWRARAQTAERERDEVVAEFGPFTKRAADALADEVGALVRRRAIDSRSPAADALLDYRDPPSSPRADRLAELEAERDSLCTELNRYKSAAPVVNSVVGEQNTTIEALRAELLAANANTAARKVDYIQVRGHLAVLRKVVHDDNVTNQCTGDAGCWCDDCKAEREEESGWELPAVVKATAQRSAMELAAKALSAMKEWNEMPIVKLADAERFDAALTLSSEALAALAVVGVKP